MKWNSSEPSIVSLTNFGTIVLLQGLQPGTSEITATDETGKKISLTVKVQPKGTVDLGLPSHKLWATKNVRANKSTDYGDFYAWGELTSWNNSTEANYMTSYSLSTLRLTDDVAYNNVGHQWRMPTEEEMQEMIDGCTWKRVEEGGVVCYKGTSKKNSNTILLPACGIKTKTQPDGEYQLNAYYWTSTKGSSNSTNLLAKCLILTANSGNSAYSGIVNVNGGKGCFVRPISFQD